MARPGEATTWMQTSCRLFDRIYPVSHSPWFHSRIWWVQEKWAGEAGYVTQGNSTILARINFGFNLQHCKIKKPVRISEIQIYWLRIYMYFWLVVFLFLVCVQCRFVYRCMRSCKSQEMLLYISLCCFLSYLLTQNLSLGLKLTDWLNSLYRDL